MIKLFGVATTCRSFHVGIETRSVGGEKKMKLGEKVSFRSTWNNLLSLVNFHVNNSFPCERRSGNRVNDFQMLIFNIFIIMQVFVEVETKNKRDRKMLHKELQCKVSIVAKSTMNYLQTGV